MQGPIILKNKEDIHDILGQEHTKILGHVLTILYQIDHKMYNSLGKVNSNNMNITQKMCSFLLKKWFLMSLH